GVPPNLPQIRAAADAGATVIGEMEFAATRCRSRMLAVTGTNGKTTTTELLRACIGACGNSVDLCGNNARPLSEAVMADPAPLYLVVEVSSYQLETIRAFRPWIATVLNVTPDHITRHPTIEEYAAVKARIFENQGAGDVAVVNADDALTARMAQGGVQRRVPFSLTQQLEDGVHLEGSHIVCDKHLLAYVDDVRIPGKHNLSNVFAALAMLWAGRFPMDKVRRGLHGFAGVEHRIETVLTHNHVTWINDSKATNLDNMKVALESMKRPVVLIAGGRGKGDNYRKLRPSMKAMVRAIIAIGEDALKIGEAWGDLTPVRLASGMADAVARAAAVAQRGDVVLLSPGCASFDQFDDFEHRGRVFKECVREIAGAGVTA
ncbi:MAG: UDP-N-acetylmuramoyl-L-alanine--D-glutamate ligase, partial [Candidatus Hydrogenedentales bacterium]